jgi:hypothetical protein
MSNGLIELISLAELDAVMLTMLTPSIKNKYQQDEGVKNSFDTLSSDI